MAGSASAAALLQTSPPASLIAPDLVLPELLNAGWKARRIGAITNEQFEAIGTAGPLTVQRAFDYRPAADGRKPVVPALDHPAYDCLHLALAELQGGVLVSQDQRLRNKLQDIRSAKS